MTNGSFFKLSVHGLLAVDNSQTNIKTVHMLSWLNGIRSARRHAMCEVHMHSRTN